MWISGAVTHRCPPRSLAVGAVGGLFALPVAVLAHEVSELLVISNGLRMLKS